MERTSHPDTFGSVRLSPFFPQRPQIDILWSPRNDTIAMWLETCFGLSRPADGLSRLLIFLKDDPPSCQAALGDTNYCRPVLSSFLLCPCSGNQVVLLSPPFLGHHLRRGPSSPLLPPGSLVLPPFCRNSPFPSLPTANKQPRTTRPNTRPHALLCPPSSPSHNPVLRSVSLYIARVAEERSPRFLRGTGGLRFEAFFLHVFPGSPPFLFILVSVRVLTRTRSAMFFRHRLSLCPSLLRFPLFPPGTCALRPARRPGVFHGCTSLFFRRRVSPPIPVAISLVDDGVADLVSLSPDSS